MHQPAPTQVDGPGSRRAGPAVLKAVQADWTTHDWTGPEGQTVALFWNRAQLACAGSRVLPGRDNSKDRPRASPGQGRGHHAGCSSRTTDARHRLTINAGCAPSRDVPRYSLPGATRRRSSSSLRREAGPRAGAAYDVTGDGRWKLYAAGASLRHLQVQPVHRFGGLTRLAIPSPRHVRLRRCCQSGVPACPGTTHRRTLAAPMSRTSVDPDLDPMKLQEAVVGVEHSCGPPAVVGAVRPQAAGPPSRTSVRWTHLQ